MMESVWGRIEWGQWIEPFLFRNNFWCLRLWQKCAHLWANEWVCSELCSNNCWMILLCNIVHTVVWAVAGVVLEAISIYDHMTAAPGGHWECIASLHYLSTDNPEHGWTSSKRKHSCRMVVSIWPPGLYCWSLGFLCMKEDRVRPHVETAEINLVSAADVEKRTHQVWILVESLTNCNQIT